VVERDGEALPVTEDYDETRINVAVVTVDDVEQVVRATTDGGVLIAEITIEPTDPAIDGDPVAIEAELLAAFDGLLPMPLEEFTDEAEALGFATRVVTRDGEPLEVTADYSLRRVNVEVTDGQVVAIDSVG
jgi:hypothetical protein